VAALIANEYGDALPQNEYDTEQVEVAAANDLLAGVVLLIEKYTVVPPKTSNEYTLDGVPQVDDTVVFLAVQSTPFVLYPTSIGVAPMLAFVLA
jgi:hypothetical protein